MVGWESRRTRILCKVVNAQHRGFTDHHAENSPPPRQFADGDPFVLRHPAGDEVAQVGPTRRQHAERTVASLCEIDGEVDDALQQRRKRELCRQRQPRVEETFGTTATECHPSRIISLDSGCSDHCRAYPRRAPGVHAGRPLRRQFAATCSTVSAALSVETRRPRNARTLASAMRCMSSRSSRRPTAPSGGSYLPRRVSWVRFASRGATSRSALSTGKSPGAAVAVQVRGTTVTSSLVSGSPTSTLTVLPSIGRALSGP